MEGADLSMWAVRSAPMGTAYARGPTGRRYDDVNVEALARPIAPAAGRSAATDR